MGELDTKPFATFEPMRELPEEAVAGGIRATLAYLQKDQKRARIAGLAEELRAEPETTLASAEFQNAPRDAQKNALLSAALAEFWPKASQRMSENKGVVAVPTSSGLVTVPDMRIREKFAINPLLGFRDLRQRSISFFSGLATEWWGEYQNTPIRNALTESLREFGPRYVELTNPYHVDGGALFARGFVTGSDIIWGLFKSVHYAYEVQHKKPMSEQVFSEMLPEMRRLCMLLATQRLDLFTEGFSPAVIGDHDQFETTLKLQGLQVAKGESGWHIDFEPGKLREIARGYFMKEKSYKSMSRTGCPALYMMGEDGNNVIGQYFDWTTTLLEKHYYPYLEKE